MLSIVINFSELIRHSDFKASALNNLYGANNKTTYQLAFSMLTDRFGLSQPKKKQKKTSMRFFNIRVNTS